jgi:hypothetical protein
MFKIGEFARFNRTTVKALRHDDALGLLQPGEVDAFTGYRYYTAEQMPHLSRILAIIPDYGEQQPLWDEIFNWMEHNHVKTAPPLTAVFFDIGYKDSQVDVEVACPIA